MKRARDILVLLILAGIAIKLLSWAVEPFIPLIIALFLMVLISGTVFYKKKTW